MAVCSTKPRKEDGRRLRLFPAKEFRLDKAKLTLARGDEATLQMTECKFVQGDENFRYVAGAGGFHTLTSCGVKSCRLLETALVEHGGPTELTDNTGGGGGPIPECIAIGFTSIMWMTKESEKGAKK